MTINKQKLKTQPSEPWDDGNITPQLRMWLNRIYEPLKDHLTIEMIKKLIVDNHYSETMIQMAMNELFENIGDDSEWQVAERKSNKNMLPISPGLGGNIHSLSVNLVTTTNDTVTSITGGVSGSPSTSLNDPRVSNSVLNNRRSPNTYKRRPYRGGRGGNTNSIGGRNTNGTITTGRGGRAGNRVRKSGRNFSNATNTGGHTVDGGGDCEDTEVMYNHDANNNGVTVADGEFEGNECSEHNHESSSDSNSSSSSGDKEPKKPTWADRLKLRPEKVSGPIVRDKPPQQQPSSEVNTDIATESDSNTRATANSISGNNTNDSTVSGDDHNDIATTAAPTSIINNNVIDPTAYNWHLNTAHQTGGSEGIYNMSGYNNYTAAVAADISPNASASRSLCFEQTADTCNGQLSAGTGGIWNISHPTDKTLSEEIAATTGISFDNSTLTERQHPPGILVGLEDNNPPSMYQDIELLVESPVEAVMKRQISNSGTSTGTGVVGYTDLDTTTTATATVVQDIRPSSPLNPMNSTSVIPQPSSSYSPVVSTTSPVGASPSVVPPQHHHHHGYHSPFPTHYDMVGPAPIMIGLGGHPQWQPPPPYHTYIMGAYQHPNQSSPTPNTGPSSIGVGFYPSHSPPGHPSIPAILPHHTTVVHQQQSAQNSVAPTSDDHHPSVPGTAPPTAVVIEHHPTHFGAYHNPHIYHHHHPGVVPHYAMPQYSAASGTSASTATKHGSVSTTGEIYTTDESTVNPTAGNSAGCLIDNTTVNHRGGFNTSTFGMYNIHAPQGVVPGTGNTAAATTTGSPMHPTIETPPIIGPHHTMAPPVGGYYYYPSAVAPPGIDNTVGSMLLPHQHSVHCINSNSLIPSNNMPNTTNTTNDIMNGSLNISTVQDVLSNSVRLRNSVESEER